jgi:hypothetical protein
MYPLIWVQNLSFEVKETPISQPKIKVQINKFENHF